MRRVPPGLKHVTWLVADVKIRAAPLLIALMGAMLAPSSAHAQVVETTTLSSITVAGAPVPDFDAERTAYTVGLANSVATATVVATPTVSAATVACSSDSDDTAEGCQVSLTAGAGVDLTLTVTNGSSESEYTVTLNRGLSGTFAWKASDDFYGMPAALEDNGNANRNGKGIWSDGSTLWATNVAIGEEDSRVFAFNRETKAHDPSNDIDLWNPADRNLQIQRPHGAAGFGDGLVLVAGRSDILEYGRVQGYERNTAGMWAPHVDWLVFINEAEPDGRTISGIWAEEQTRWSDFDVDTNFAAHGDPGPTVWIAFNRPSDHIYPFFLDANNVSHQIFGADIPLHSSNSDPQGLWSDGETVWVADISRHIFAYDMISKSRVTAKEFTSTHLTVKGTTLNPWGIWSDGTTLWVMGGDEFIYSFNMPLSDNTELRQLEVQHATTPELDATQREHAVVLPPGTTSTTLTMAPRNRFAKVEASPLDTNLSLDGHQVDLASGPVEVTITVTAVDGTAGIYTVTVGPEVPLLTDVTLSPNSGQLHVSWQQPANIATLGVTAYDLRYARTADESSLEDDDRWAVVEDVWTTGGGDLSHLLSGLTNDEPYYVQVRAVNALGPGPWLPHERIAESATGTPVVSELFDAPLTSITVNDVAIAGFASDRGRYILGFDNSVATATVIGTAGNAAATVECGIDTDPGAEGCQVSLAAGTSTEVRLTVRHGANFGNYAVTLNRGHEGGIALEGIQGHLRRRILGGRKVPARPLERRHHDVGVEQRSTQGAAGPRSGDGDPRRAERHPAAAGQRPVQSTRARRIRRRDLRGRLRSRARR